MKWSLRLGSVAGISVYLHWTFVLLIGWIFFSHLAQEHNVAMATRGAACIMAIFGCVVLHELGHALAARMRNELVKAIAHGGRQAMVGSAMRQNCATINVSEPLRATFEKMGQSKCSTLPVVQDGRLVGLLTLENVGELVMVNEAANQFERKT